MPPPASPSELILLLEPPIAGRLLIFLFFKLRVRERSLIDIKFELFKFK